MRTISDKPVSCKNGNFPSSAGGQPTETSSAEHEESSECAARPGQEGDDVLAPPHRCSQLLGCVQGHRGKECLLSQSLSAGGMNLLIFLAKWQVNLVHGKVVGREGVDASPRLYCKVQSGGYSNSLKFCIGLHYYLSTFN